MISQGPSMCLFNKEDPQEVLASWLFMQYLLTDSVQIRYSCTEGYVPVTTKAQGSEAYQDYLSREGEDDSEHYSVKHLHHPGIQRLRVTAQRRRGADRKRDQIRPPEEDRGR